MVEIKSAELLLAPKVRYCSEQYRRRAPELPGLFAEDTVGLRLNENILIGYLADAAPNQREIHDYKITVFVSRIFARLMGEVFVETVLSIQDWEEVKGDSLWENFKENLKKSAVEEIRKQFSDNNIQLDKSFDAQIQVAFTGFFWKLDENRVFLYQFGDGYTFVERFDRKSISRYTGSTTFTSIKVRKNQKERDISEDGDEGVDLEVDLKVVDKAQNNQIYELENINRMILISDGVLRVGDIRDLNTQGMDEIYKAVKESVRKDDDKSAIIIEVSQREDLQEERDHDNVESEKSDIDLETKRDSAVVDKTSKGNLPEKSIMKSKMESSHNEPAVHENRGLWVDGKALIEAMLVANTVLLIVNLFFLAVNLIILGVSKR